MDQSPEKVLAFLRTASEDQIREAVHDIGTPTALAVVFGGMAERFGLRPGRVPGLLVVELDDDGVLHRHGVQVSEGGASHVADPAGAARGTLRTTLVRFLRIAAGAEDPKRLVVTGRLKLSGDVLWTVTTLGSLRR